MVPRPGTRVLPDQLIAHCEPRLARFKRPTIVAVVDELPHSATGKVAKARLRAEADRRNATEQPA